MSFGPNMHSLFYTICIFCLQCFIVSTVNALQTPMINASMVGFLFWAFWCLLHVSLSVQFLSVQGQVLCDRHYGGINYPVGGVGGIARSLAGGLVDQGSEILYKANVKSIILDDGKAVSFCITLATYIPRSCSKNRSSVGLINNPRVYRVLEH